MNMKVHYMHEKQDWRTPKWLLDSLTNEFGELFDPCPVNPKFDGLKTEWRSPAYCNPPYGKEISKWLQHGFLQWNFGRLDIVVFLLPARTDTRWFHNYAPLATEIIFFKGRLKFCVNESYDAKDSAPFPSMLLIFSHVRFSPKVRFENCMVIE